MKHLPLIALVVAAAPAAHAASNDINLAQLVKKTPDEGELNGGFRFLVQELGLVFTPASLQPAETTGQSGFDFALDYTFHTFDFDQAYWQNARENPATPLLMTLGARARKGFVLPVPLASEVEFGAQWLIDAQLLSMGTNIRVALNEGFRWIPDLALQAGINRMVGNKDLDLLTVSAGGQISKGFGIAGSFNLAPYVGYQSIWVNGSTRIIDLDPSDAANVDDNTVLTQVPLGANRMDRVSTGVRWVIAVVQITGGLDFNFLGADGTGRADEPMFIQYSLRAGVTF